MRKIDVTTERSLQAIDVTDLVTAQRWPDGWLILSVPHTTAALIIGENDPEMLEDYEKVAAGLPAPFEPFKHHRNDNPSKPDNRKPRSENHFLPCRHGGYRFPRATAGGTVPVSLNTFVHHNDSPQSRMVGATIVA